jgi:hypothetical protein
VFKDLKQKMKQRDRDRKVKKNSPECWQLV